MNPDKTEKLMSAIRSGIDLETASHFAGFSVTEVYRWLERGKVASEMVVEGIEVEKAEETYLDFWEELRKARAESIVRNVAHVQQAANNGSWQAATWWLERAVPEIYSKGAVDKKLEQSQGQKREIQG